MLATTLAVIAIVTQDQSALRAAPRDSAPQQVLLWQGDSLEIRAQKGDYLQVYDHRRERAGFIRATQVRSQSLAPEAAPDLLSVVRFLRDTPGAEALGISYAAAYVQAAPAQLINGEVFDALGGMAERLADRASSRRAKNLSADNALAAHLEIVASYGVVIRSFERSDGQMQLCYDGEAHRRVLALPASDAQKALAALALTRHDCVDPQMNPSERVSLDQWRAEVLDRVDTKSLSEVLKNRLSLRKAGVWAALAYHTARRAAPGEVLPVAVHSAGQRALQALAVINKSELSEVDASAYNDAAARVGASRWAAELAPTAELKTPAGSLSIAVSAGQPGERCVHLLDARHDLKNPLLTRCTFGVVWAASASADAQGKALTLAVQPLASWREMWVFRQGEAGWQVDVLPPGLDSAQAAYVEFAGWVPGKAQFLAAREGRVEGRYKRSFEVLDTNGLRVEKQADQPGSLSTFYRWQSPLWKAQTVSLR